jgi:hypothetical protein
MRTWAVFHSRDVSKFEQTEILPRRHAGHGDCRSSLHSQLSIARIYPSRDSSLGIPGTWGFSVRGPLPWLWGAGMYC